MAEERPAQLASLQAWKFLPTQDQDKPPLQHGKDDLKQRAQRQSSRTRDQQTFCLPRRIHPSLVDTSSRAEGGEGLVEVGDQERVDGGCATLSDMTTQVAGAFFQGENGIRSQYLSQHGE